MEIKILELTQQQASGFWSELEPYVQRALSFDMYASTSVADLERQVKQGYARVLICARGEDLLAANVVQLFKTTIGERVLHVLATAGDESNVWLAPLIDLLNDIAATEGATAITMSGRPGWGRKLRPYGFKTDQVQLRRPVNNGRIQEQTAVATIEQ